MSRWQTCSLFVLALGVQACGSGKPSAACQQEVTDLTVWLGHYWTHPDTTPRPPPAPVQPRLDTIEQMESEAAEYALVQVFREVTSDCPAVFEVATKLAASPSEEKFKVLVDDLPPAMAACGCASDQDSLKAVLWAMGRRLHPDLAMPVVKDCSKEVAAFSQWASDLAFKSPQAQPPPASRVDQRLAAAGALEPAARSAELVATYKEIMAGCPDVDEPLQAVAGSAADQKMVALSESLPMAVATCDCEVDLVALQAWVWSFNQGS